MNSLALFFQGGGAGGLLTGMLPFVLIIVIFYFVLIRPQKQKQQQLQQMIANIKSGDKIITRGGIIGIVISVKEESLIIKTAEKSMIEVARSAVAGKDIAELEK
jgi:preprotein translocase subunit YajC